MDGGGSHRGPQTRARARLPPLGARPSPPFCPGPLEKVVFSSTAFLCRFSQKPRQPAAFKRFSAGAACERVGPAGRSRPRPLRQPRGCTCSRQHLHTVPRCQTPGPTRKTAQEWVGWLLQQPGAGGPAQARASHKSPGHRGRGLMGRFSRQTPAPTLRPCWPPGPASTPAPLTGTALLARHVSRVL